LNVNSLGIRYFSRFRVTFDFPGRAVYLQRGAHYTRAEPCATSGLTLNWIGGEAVVESVREQGPADVVGIRPGDLLVSVNDNDAVVHDPFILRQLLTSEGGRKVAMTVNRGGRVLGFELVLAAE
jgi:predicted metalloprotease with PDZ domain